MQQDKNVDYGKVGTNALTSLLGLGLLTANNEARLALNEVGNPQLSKVLPDITDTSKRLKDIIKLAPEDRALAYAALAHELAAKKIKTNFTSSLELPNAGGKKPLILPVDAAGNMATGHWALAGQYRLADYAKKSPLLRMLSHIPGLKSIPNFIQSRRKYYESSPGQLAASFQHYDNFSKSPGHAWLQMINELPDDKRVIPLFMPKDAITYEQFKALSPEAKQKYASKFAEGVPRFVNEYAIDSSGRLLSAEEIAKKGITPNKTLSFQDIVSDLVAHKASNRNSYMQHLSQLQLPANTYDWGSYVNSVKDRFGITDDVIKSIETSAMDKFKAANPNLTGQALADALENARFKATKQFMYDTLHKSLEGSKKYGVSLQSHLSNSLYDNMANNFVADFAKTLQADPKLAARYGGADKFMSVVNGVKNDRAAENFLHLLRTDKSLFDKYLHKVTNPLINTATLGPEAEFAKILSGLRMTSAYKGYGSAAPVVNILSKLKHPATGILGAAAAGVGGYGLYKNFTKEASSESEREHSRGSAALEGLLGLLLSKYGIENAGQMLHENGWRKLNPFSKNKVLVLGGTETDILDELTGKPTGEKKLQTNSSFNAQRAAAAKSLKDSGLLDVTEAPLYYEPGNVRYKKNGLTYNTLYDTYKPIDLGLVPSNTHNIDAIYQLGAHPEAYTLGRLSNNKNIIRYRQLSDFGAGNFRQPAEWIGSTNWMGVLDDKSGYDRFVVPGAAEDMPKYLKGKKSNLFIDNISVNDKLYGNSPFAETKGEFSVPIGDAETRVRSLAEGETPESVKLNKNEFIKTENGKSSVWKTNAVPDGFEVRPDATGVKRIYAPGAGGHWMTMGGGAGSFLPIMDVADTANNSYFLNKRGLIDDWAEAIATNPATKNDSMHILLGGTYGQDTPAARHYRKLEKLIDDVHASKSFEDFHAKYPELDADLARSRFNTFKNMKLWPATRGMAEIYQNAKSIAMLPGSTGAEAMRMPGTALPRIINMIPDETLGWMPKHWSTNAEVYNKLLGGKNISISDATDRVNKIKDIIGDASPIIKPDRVPLKPEFSEIAKRLSSDIRKQKLARFGRFAGNAGTGLLGLAATADGIYNAATGKSYLMDLITGNL